MNETFSTSLIKKQSIAEVVAHRDRAIECLNAAFDYMVEAQKAFKRAAETSYGINFRNMPEPSGYSDDHTAQAKACRDWARKEVDEDVWAYLLGASGLKNLMDAEAVSQFREQLRKDPPECTVENINATFARLNEGKADTFVRGLINVFAKLDYKRYKTNDAFKITHRIILHGYLSSCGGGFAHWQNCEDRIGDLCRIMHILDGKPPKDHLGDFRSVIRSVWTWSKKEPVAESEYFHARLFRNGNIHLTFKRIDLVEKANRMIAAHYGKTLAAA